MINVTQRIPNMFAPHRESLVRADVNNLEELKNIPFIKSFISKSDFISLNIHLRKCGQHLLGAVFQDYKIVIAFLKGDVEKLGLPTSRDYTLSPWFTSDSNFDIIYFETSNEFLSLPLIKRYTDLSNFSRLSVEYIYCMRSYDLNYTQFRLMAEYKDFGPKFIGVLNDIEGLNLPKIETGY